MVLYFEVPDVAAAEAEVPVLSRLMLDLSEYMFGVVRHLNLNEILPREHDMLWAFRWMPLGRVESTWPAILKMSAT